MTQLLTFVSLFGSVVAVVFFCTGGMKWLRDGYRGVQFDQTLDYQIAKNAWDARCLAEEAKAKALTEQEGQ